MEKKRSENHGENLENWGKTCANSIIFRDLSKIKGLKDVIIESFNHNSEEVKSAASYALGNISLGNLGDYVPFVLNEIETQPKRQYLLLHSLKEVKYNYMNLSDATAEKKSTVLT